MDNVIRTILSVPGFLLAIIVCVALSIWLCRSLYRRLQNEYPEAKIRNMIFSVLGTLVVLAMLLFFVTFAIGTFGSRWCEGCQEYH